MFYWYTCMYLCVECIYMMYMRWDFSRSWFKCARMSLNFPITKQCINACISISFWVLLGIFDVAKISQFNIYSYGIGNRWNSFQFTNFKQSFFHCRHIFSLIFIQKIRIQKHNLRIISTLKILYFFPSKAFHWSLLTTSTIIFNCNALIFYF